MANWPSHQRPCHSYLWLSWAPVTVPSCPSLPPESVPFLRCYGGVASGVWSEVWDSSCSAGPPPQPFPPSAQRRLDGEEEPTIHVALPLTFWDPRPLSAVLAAG